MMSYQTPRGTYDILPEEVRKWQDLEQKLRDIASRYDYEEIRTPYFEDTGVFARKGDSSDMVNKEMYSFGDNGSFTLRPEGTAGVIRSFDQHKLYGSMEMPARFYYVGPMFRHERPQKGRQRQFTQFGVENIGLKDSQLDAETIALGIDIVRSMGIRSIKVCINTLGDDASRKAYNEALRAYFAPHIDELCGDCHRRLEQNPLRILDCKVDHDLDLVKNAPRLADYLNEESRAYFDGVLKALDAMGIEYEIDDRLVRGLDYYTHTVFEVISTRPESGAQATIFGGGRYDHLVEYFGGPEMSGMGFAIGLERLLALAGEDGYAFPEKQPLDAYIITLGEVGAVPLAIASQLRQAGMRVVANFTKRSLKSQFKSADRTHAKHIIIVGEEELKNNTVNVKNTGTGVQETVSLEQLSSKLQGEE